MTNALVRRWIFLPAFALPLCAQTLTSPLKFGNQVQNTTSTALPATLQNTNTRAITITSIAVTGNFAQSNTCPLSPAKLAKGASCIILVTFTPATIGALSGKLTVTDNAADSPQTSSLTGTGIAPVVVSPASWTFAKLPLGEISPAETFTLTNNQSTALSINNVFAAPANFVIASNTCGASIGPLATCTVGVTFSPSVTGITSGTLSFSDGAANTPQIATLSGTGTAAVLSSIAVTPADASIYAGATEQFTATGTYSNGSIKVLTTATWTAAPTGIASISTTGLATGLEPGISTITAALGAISGNTMLTVIPVFVTTGSLNTARYYHSATMLTSGTVLFTGGIGYVPGGTGALGELASAELYNPSTDSFTFTGSLNTARDEHSATLLNSGKVLIAGGSGGDGELASAEVYTAATAAFAYTGSLNTARYEHTATLLPNATVLIAGGYGAAGVLNSAELYNPATGKFVVILGMNDARFGATATLLPSGLVLIAGGADANGPLSSAELYDPVAGTFTLTPATLNVARSGATATLLNTGNVLIADGYDYLTTGPLTSAELYNPANGTFMLTGSEAATAWLGTATLLTNSNVLTAGSALNAAAAELYSPAGGTFSLTAALNTPGDLQTATLLPDGTVLIAAGHSNTGGSVLANAELYEPPTLVPLNLASIAIAPSTVSLNTGASQQLIATGTFVNSSTQNLASAVWISSNPSVATVTDDITNSGVVYGVAAGSATITACTGTICGSLPVTVTTP